MKTTATVGFRTEEECKVRYRVALWRSKLEETAKLNGSEKYVQTLLKSNRGVSAEIEVAPKSFSVRKMQTQRWKTEWTHHLLYV